MNIQELFGENLIKSLKEQYINEDGSICAKGIWKSSVFSKFPEFKTIFENNFSNDYFREVMFCILKDIKEIRL